MSILLLWISPDHAHSQKPCSLSYIFALTLSRAEEKSYNCIMPIYLLVIIAPIILVLATALLFSVRKLQLSKKALEGERSYRDTLLESLPSGIIEYDHEFKIIDLNRALELLTGVSRSKTEGRRMRPSDRDNPDLAVLATMMFGTSDEEIKFPDKIIHREFSFREPRELIVTATYVPINAIWMKKGIALLIIEDLPREKLIGQMKTEFISIAAHQLRTPLSIIKWTIRMLLDGDVGQLNEKQREFLQRGFETNERMVTLVSDLLNVNRIEEGRFGYEFKKGDLIAFLKQIVAGRNPMTQERNIQVNLKFHAEREEMFFDPEKLSLAITNIIDNAIKYTPPGGNIEIITKIVLNKIEIAIKDNGVGIPERQKNRLFSKFFRGTNVVRMQTEGSGLGLFISKNVIAAHGGNIRAESEEGIGTTMYITLPLGAIPPAQDEYSSSMAAV